MPTTLDPDRIREAFDQYSDEDLTVVQDVLSEIKDERNYISTEIMVNDVAG